MSGMPRPNACVGKNAKRVNGVLSALLTQVSNRILELRMMGQYDKLTPAQLREMLTHLDLSAPTIGVPTLGAMFQKVIDTKTGGTRTLFEQTLNKVNAFCGDANAVRFETINKTWLTGFCGFDG